MGESAIVLCGGRGTRIGRDKASLPFGPETLLARVVRLVREVADDVVLVAREGQPLPAGFEAARDPREGLGPLAGIAVGLGAVRGARALVVACDMPLLRAPLALRLLERSEGVDACVPVVDGYPVPTCAVYASSAARARASFWLCESCARGCSWTACGRATSPRASFAKSTPSW